MKRKNIFSVPYQNKKAKYFFVLRSSYSDCIAPAALPFPSLAEGRTQRRQSSSCKKMLLFEDERNAKSYSISSQISPGT
ncbi:hypothetical protein FE241_13680 [Raoultella terrigena]|nr:hypothetical protein [Raoultella terrigena]HCR56469.1 hypothetical protein [Raoultella sp.]